MWCLFTRCRRKNSTAAGGAKACKIRYDTKDYAYHAHHSNTKIARYCCSCNDTRSIFHVCLLASLWSDRSRAPLKPPEWGDRSFWLLWYKNEDKFGKKNCAFTEIISKKPSRRKCNLFVTTRPSSEELTLTWRCTNSLLFLARWLAHLLACRASVAVAFPRPGGTRRNYRPYGFPNFFSNFFLTNFKRPVLGCIDATCCKYILVWKLLTRSTRSTHFCTAPNSKLL
jgi:hypothetical protein